MTRNIYKAFLAIPLLTVGLATSASAGGLSDAIIERQPQIVEQSPPEAMPGWVLPVVGLVVLGIIATQDGGSDGGGDTVPTKVLPTAVNK